MLFRSVTGRYHKDPYLKRQLVVTHEGDVPFETYFHPDETTDVVISRQDFLIQKRQGLSGKETYVFPEKISLEESSQTEEAASSRSTTLIFNSLEFNPEIAFKDWELPIPAGTKRVNVSEGFEEIEKAAQG